ncbi:hypothetical protein [Ramlibacter sp. Leaf400]|uniref:hypothetical protein n=1 Tax=Ramlibacter sp. Leaf400 TaxID=1736365 RepID=UPI0006F69339|nr:hypothetical protein [Ramlibacter sp. Leaf400]KQT08054.1 hypothetical protein ASG30_16620 [Ramlibacter sp. Leaf400]
MALTPDSIAGTVRRKARSAHDNVKAAEEDLVAANAALKAALPRRDVDAIAQAAERTVVAEEEVRQAAHDLDVVNELLVDALPPAGVSGGSGGASGEGARSLLPWLRGGS